MIRNNENSPSSRSDAGKSLLKQYRERMARKQAVTHAPDDREEIQQLIELADDLNVLFERS